MKASRIIIILVLVALLGLLVYQLTPREPEYKGRSLSSWLKDLDDGRRSNGGLTWEAWTNRNSRKPAVAEAEEAIRQMGTNTLPYLLHALTNRDSAQKKYLVDLLARQNRFKIHIPMAADDRRPVEFAFHALGTAGSNAVPELTKALLAPGNDVNGSAASSLAGIGPPGWAVLIEILGHTNAAESWATVCAAWALGSHHVTGPGTISALIGQMTNTTPGGSTALVEWAVGEIGQDSEEVVPALIFELGKATSMQTDVKWSAAQSLAKFGTNASSAVPALLTAMQDPDMTVRQNAQTALKAIDPEAAAKAGVK